MNDTPPAPQQPAGDTPPNPPQPPRYAPPRYQPPQAPQTPQAPQQPQYGQQPQPQQPYAPQPPTPWQPAGSAPGQPYPAPQYQVPPYQQQYQAPQYQSFGEPGPGEPFDGATHPADLSRPLYGANIGQAFIRFFKNYVSFSGRASRSEYWWVALMLGVAWIVFLILVGIIDSAVQYSSGISYGAASGFESLMGFVFFIFWAGLILPSLSITWRRLHDANFAGPMFFLGFIPFFGGIVLLILHILPSKVEGRRFARTH